MATILRGLHIAIKETQVMATILWDLHSALMVISLVSSATTVNMARLWPPSTDPDLDRKSLMQIQI
jgi:hypothetical protein